MNTTPVEKKDDTILFDLRTTKQELREEAEMSHTEFRKYINPIISKNRNITLEQAKNERRVRHTEVIMFYANIAEDINMIIAKRKKLTK